MGSRARKWLRLPLGLLLALIVFVGGGMITQASTQLIPIDPGMQMWLTTMIFQLSMGLIALIIMLLLGRGRLRAFGFCRGSHLPLVKVLLAVFIVEAFISITFLAFPKPGEGHFAGDYSFWQIVVGIWIVASTIEEIVSRGMFQSFLEPLARHRLPLPRIALSIPVIAGAVIFAAMHVPLLVMGIDRTLGIQILISTFGLGLIAGYFRESTGSLLPAVIAHSFANIAGMGIEKLFEVLGRGAI